jgi:ribosomal protein L7/L12
MSLTVIEYAIDQIKEYDRNARTHSKEQIAQIAESIRQFGFTNPVLLDKDGVLIAGHGRLAAARQIGRTTVPAIQLDQLTPTQVRALRIADNKIALNSGWNQEMLAAEFAKLADIKFDLAVTGFELKEIKFIVDRNNTTIEEVDKAYTRKVKAPIYEITGKRPALSELYDTSKTDALITEIEKAKLPKDLKAFLIEAARRHTVFQYAKIAEFYAHADPGVQDLMEKSALVILDFDKAIENGFVRLSDEIAELYKEDHGNAA